MRSRRIPTSQIQVRQIQAHQIRTRQANKLVELQLVKV